MAASRRPGGTRFSFTAKPPAGGEFMVEFPAYLTSISDSYAGSWNEHMDMGRGDPKFMYSQYSRNLSVSFMTAALEPKEKSLWFEALNSLTEMTKPQYQSGLGFNGVFCRMVIGELIDEIGFIESVDVSIDNETPWIEDLPLVVSVDVGFRVIGDKKPNYRSAGGGLATKKFYGNSAPPPVEPPQPIARRPTPPLRP